MKPVIHQLCFGLGCALAAATPLAATEYYLDPVAGNPANSGTRSAPWGSLETVVAGGQVFAAGDVLTLLAGHHGRPVLRNPNPGVVTVRPAPGARVTLANLTIQDGRFWTVEGLEISPETVGGAKRGALVKLSGGSDNVIRGCLLYTVRDASAWSAADWDKQACDGIFVSGTRQLIENNHLANVRFGVSVPVGAPYNTVRGNLIRNFSGDGIRGSGDYGVFEGNVVKNLHQVNKNHPDGFQSWSQTADGVGRGVVRGVTLRGNYFLSQEDPRQPFSGALQGIGCFDGFFEDWVVENNVVITRAWHGIAFYGARQCRIVNNTVADLDLNDKAVPWLKITAHKDGTPSTGNLVRNNLVGALAVDRGSAQLDHNVLEPDARRFFSQGAGGERPLKGQNTAIDAGTSDGAPAIDVRGAPRTYPGNPAWDAGAYEFGAPETDAAATSQRPGEPRLNVPPMPDTPPPSLARNY